MNSEQIAAKQRKIIERNRRQYDEDMEQIRSIEQWRLDHPDAWGPGEYAIMCMVACIIMAVAASLLLVYRPALFPQRTAIASVVVPTCNRCHLSEGRIKSLSEYRRANPSPRERRMKVRPVDLAELTKKEQL